MIRQGMFVTRRSFLSALTAAANKPLAIPGDWVRREAPDLFPI